MSRVSRVLFVRTDPGAFDPRILKEATTLHEAGYEVGVFGWDRRGEVPATEVIEGVRFRRTRLPGPYGSKLLAVVLPLFWLRTVAELVRRAPDVVHAADLDALIPALLARVVRRFRVVYDIFDMFGEKIPGLPGRVRRLIRSVDQACMRRADRIIVTDERRMEYLPPALRGRAVIIMNVPKQVPPPLPYPEESQFQLCYTGSIVENRGLRSIVKAVHALPGVRTVFAGWCPRADDEAYLQAQDGIEYIGRITHDRALRLQAESNAMLALYDPSLPINARASSNKVFEAMAVGRPVISNHGTTMADLVTAHACGILVRYGDTEELREAIRRLMSDRNLGRRYGENGLRAFQRLFRWEIMRDRLLGLYRTLTDPRPPMPPGR